MLQAPAFGVHAESTVGLYRVPLSAGGNAARVFLSREPYIANDAQHDPRFIQRFVRLFDTRNTVTVPRQLARLGPESNPSQAAVVLLCGEVRRANGRETLARKLTRTVMPEGRAVHMQPMAVDRADAHTDLAFPHKYGADTRRVLGEAGYSGADLDSLGRAGVIA